MNRKNLTSAAPVLGVDIGRVIIEGDGPDTNFVGGSEADAMRAPAVPGAIEALTRLCRRFEGRVWLVSKCGSKVQQRTRQWLDRTRFFQTTGIPYGHVRFCRDRKDKAPICAELGIGLFVDDRLDVLQAMSGVVPHRFQFLASEAPEGIVPVRSWVEAEAAILEDALLAIAG
ncbi:MAG: hypothetical protein KIT84_13700 [Labilithrix sp.]|nr:hypothetical protein [Labilithrix sp.]MCW5812073.1 hypothetical protein [Labilithrix sp.]